jgi:transposase
MEVRVRGTSKPQLTMLSLQTPEQRVPQKHPLRAVKRMADEALRGLAAEIQAMYSTTGRPSIPPERLLKASLLMALYTVRSERMFCEQLDYNLLFRWFLDMDMVEESFDHSSFTRNRERLLKHEFAGKFFGAVVQQARAARLMSDEHFSVDGTLIEAWASIKSFRPKDEPKDPPVGGDGNAWKDFKGESRSNDTHESKTDPEAKLLRKGDGREAKLCFAGHVLMENRNGLVSDVLVTPSVGTTETDAAIEMMERTFRSNRGRTVGADRGYDNAKFVETARALGATPHVVQNHSRRGGSTIDNRTTKHETYSISLRWRMRIEEIFGWMKTTAGLRRTRLRGVQRNQLSAYLVAAAYNLLRMAKLCPA